jgi:hypothetical protein
MVPNVKILNSDNASIVITENPTMALVKVAGKQISVAFASPILVYPTTSF